MIGSLARGPRSTIPTAPLRRVATLVLLGATGCGRQWYGPVGVGSGDAGSIDAGSIDAGSVDARGPDASSDATLEDAGGLDVGPDASALPDLGATFRNVVEHVPVNTVGREYGTALSRDGLTVAFASYGAPPAGANLYLARRGAVSELFSGRTLVLDASTDENDGEPTFGLDDGELYFDRVGVGVHRCDLAGDRCTGSVPVPGYETFEGPDLAVGGLHLVVSAGGDLYESVRASRTDAWPAPTLLTELSGTASDGFPALREDGLELFWERTGATGVRVWRALRPSLTAPFGPPEPVVFVGLGDVPAGDPEITADGRLLVFVARAPTGTGEFDVYTAERP